MVIQLSDTKLSEQIIDTEKEIRKKADVNISQSKAPSGIDFNTMQVGQLFVDELNLKAYYRGNKGNYTWNITRV